MSKIEDQLSELYDKPHLSYSSIKYALGDITLFDLYMKGKLRYESPALSFGTLYDDMLFMDIDDFHNKYSIVSDENIIDSLSSKARAAKNVKLTSEYKEAMRKAKEYVENVEKKILVSSDDMKTAKEMVERLKVSGLYDTFLNGLYQVEIYEHIATDSGVNVLVKGFIDCLNPDSVVDSKTTKSINKFKYSVFDFGYDIQAYIYCKTTGMDDYYWLAQEKAYPYLPAIIKCSKNTLMAGEMKFNMAVDNIKSFLNGDKGHTPDTYFEEFEV